MRQLVWFLALAILPACQAERNNFTLQEGDLLFQDCDGELADAIEAVTDGVRGAEFSHVGIVVMDQGRPGVVEASGSVRKTPLEKFLGRYRDERGRPRVVVGRLRPAWRALIPSAVGRARGMLGRPYDDVFLLDNGKYYCSELVYEVFRTGGDERLFAVAPMTFRLPGADQPLPTWRKYYAAKGVPIPEGKPGCNPAGLSRSDRLEIVHAYGRPTGWSEEMLRRYSGAARP